MNGLIFINDIYFSERSGECSRFGQPHYFWRSALNEDTSPDLLVFEIGEPPVLCGQPDGALRGPEFRPDNQFRPAQFLLKRDGRNQTSCQKKG
jgi:hypothetical protein